MEGTVFVSDFVPEENWFEAGCVTKPGPQKRLLRFKAEHNGPAVTYNMTLTDGDRVWALALRYSQLLQCHQQLQKLYSCKELPSFPPKESLSKRFLGSQKSRNSWLSERQELLCGYVGNLLAHPNLASTEPVRSFFGEEVADASFAADSEAMRSLLPEEAQDHGGVTEGGSLSSVRARLTDGPGDVDIVVRVQRCEDEAKFVWLAVLPLAPASCGACDPDALRVFQLAVGDSGEALQRMTLGCGQDWQVTAQGITGAERFSTPISITFRVPAENAGAENVKTQTPTIPSPPMFGSPVFTFQCPLLPENQHDEAQLPVLQFTPSVTELPCVESLEDLQAEITALRDDAAALLVSDELSEGGSASSEDSHDAEVEPVLVGLRDSEPRLRSWLRRFKRGRHQSSEDDCFVDNSAFIEFVPETDVRPSTSSKVREAVDRLFDFGNIPESVLVV